MPDLIPACAYILSESIDLAQGRDPQRGWIERPREPLNDGWTEVAVPQPTLPWDDEHWVAERAKMVQRHINWLVEQGHRAPVAYTYYFAKTEHEIRYRFRDLSTALMFKLVWSGM